MPRTLAGHFPESVHIAGVSERPPTVSRWPYQAPRDRGSRDHHARRHLIDATAGELRSAGYAVGVDIDDRARPTADAEAEAGASQTERVAALTARAARQVDAADRLPARAPELGAGISFDQPVLVDHHSASRDIRLRDRIDRTHRQAIEAQQSPKPRLLAQRRLRTPPAPGTAPRQWRTALVPRRRFVGRSAPPGRLQPHRLRVRRDLSAGDQSGSSPPRAVDRRADRQAGPLEHRPRRPGRCGLLAPDRQAGDLVQHRGRGGTG